MLMGLHNMELLDPYTKTIFQIYVSKLLHIKFKQTYLVVLYFIHAHYFATLLLLCACMSVHEGKGMKHVDLSMLDGTVTLHNMLDN